MKNKNHEKNEVESKNIIVKIIQGTINEIMIKGRGVGENYDKITVNIALLADDWSQKILHKIYHILQDEVDYINIFQGFNDSFSCLSNLLYQQFYDDFNKGEDLENIIKERIKDLEEENFDEVMELILSLRKRTISVYRVLLTELKNNEEKFIEYMQKYS